MHLDFRGKGTKFKDLIKIQTFLYYPGMLLFIYILVIFRWGYELRRNDSMQLSYATFMYDQSLYPTDFYIQHIHSILPNERSFFSFFASLFNNLANLALWGHLIVSLFLFAAVDRISSLYIKKMNCSDGWCRLFCLSFFMALTWVAARCITIIFL